MLGGGNPNRPNVLFVLAVSGLLAPFPYDSPREPHSLPPTYAQPSPSLTSPTPAQIGMARVLVTSRNYVGKSMERTLRVWSRRC